MTASIQNFDVVDTISLQSSDCRRLIHSAKDATTATGGKLFVQSIVRFFPLLCVVLNELAGRQIGVVAAFKEQR